MRASLAVNYQLTTLFSAFLFTIKLLTAFLRALISATLKGMHWRTYLRYVKPGAVLECVMQFQLFA